MSVAEDRHHDARIAAVLAACPGGVGAAPASFEPVPPVASPVHRAVASEGLRVRRADAPPVFLKLRHADMADDIVPWAAAAARRAAERGVGPAVLAEAEGALAFADLGPPWRTATAGDLQDPDTLGRVLGAKRRLHEGPRLGHRFCPFARVAALAEAARAAGAPLPGDAGRLLAAVELIREAVSAAGSDLRFCHNDGTASNVMLDGDRVQLVDFDSGGDNDPWYDVATLVNEACDFDAERRDAIASYAGRCEEALLNRCRLYGIVDDVRWGLWGLTRAVTSRRPGIEFFKYGQWRLFHARTATGDRGFEAWLRGL